MAETEKITINLGVVDLGQVDLLVEQGFYSSRTDFIRSAIRFQLDRHAGEVERIVHTKTMAIGITKISRRDLEELARRHERLKLQVMGMLIIDEDVPSDLFLNVVEAVQVYGSIRASADVQRVLQQKTAAK